jgi:dihydroxy-acid dehydratase
MRKGLTNYGDLGFSIFLRKAFIKGAATPTTRWTGRSSASPNTGSAYNPCHGNRAQLIEAVKRGVMLAGGCRWIPDDLDPRELSRADVDVRAQPDVDGHRGDDPRAADGCGRADRRLRQDGAGAADGRGVGGVPAIQLVTGSMLTGRIARSGSAPAPTAGATGASSAPTRSTPTKSRASTTSSSPVSARAR